jgi:photosystem II stability/assembly factor-like uncharacterized protein
VAPARNALSMRTGALLAVLVLLLAACGGEPARVLRAERLLSGRVDDAQPTRRKGWPDAETSFCDARVGFGRAQPAGGRSSVFATTDGGRTWTRRSRVDVGAATLTCLSARDVVLSAYPPLNAARPEPLLLRSRTGGRSWRRLGVPTDASSPPAVIGPDTFVATQLATSWYATRDGARSWRLVVPEPDEPLEALAFLSDDVAYAITSRGDPGKARTFLRRSDDGGRTWSAVESRIPNLGLHALSAADGTLWAHGERCPAGASCRPLLLRTGDDGRSWDVIRLPELPPELRFTSATSGVAAGPGGFYVTRDGGVTWTWHAPAPRRRQ